MPSPNFYGRQLDIGDNLKPMERRFKTLDEHIKHTKNFKAYRPQKVRNDKL
jgi:hypothetical protein